jgi:hypothetical protein
MDPAASNSKAIFQRAREREHQRAYAERYGYFWLPCPLCGDEFGGHEAWGAIPTDTEGRSEGICPSCTQERQRAAEDHLRELGRAHTFSTSRWGGDCMRHRVGARPTGEATGRALIVEV